MEINVVPSVLLMSSNNLLSSALATTRWPRAKRPAMLFSENAMGSAVVTCLSKLMWKFAKQDSPRTSAGESCKAAGRAGRRRRADRQTQWEGVLSKCYGNVVVLVGVVNRASDGSEARATANACVNNGVGTLPPALALLTLLPLLLLRRHIAQCPRWCAKSAGNSSRTRVLSSTRR